MRNAIVPAVLLLLLLTFPAVAQTTPCTSVIPTTSSLSSSLVGSNVANGLGSANGFANVALTFNGTQATVNVNSLALGNDITGLTLYQGAPGSGGVPVFTFTDMNHGFVNGSLNRTVTLNQTLINQILANPSNYFFVITTPGFPSGAVQGQLAPVTRQMIGGTLSGANVAGGVGSPTATGSYLITVSPVDRNGNVTLTYDILTNNLGDHFNNLMFLGTSGSPLFIVNGLPAATNGRLLGSTVVSAPLANQLLANPCGFTFALSTPAFPNGAVAGAVGATHEIFIPVVGSVTGALGNRWMTDLNVFNNSAIGQTSAAANANIVAQFFPSGGSSTTALNVATMTLAPRGTTTFRDLSTSVFNGTLNSIGALRLLTTSSVLASARIFDNQIASGHGTLGQFEPGMTRDQALQQGVLVGVGNVGLNGAATNGGQTFRTNVGFFNPNDTPATVALEMRDNNGNVTANRVLTLGPWMHMQLPLSGATGIFTDVTGDVSNSSVYFLSGAPIFAYASIVDNISGDASFVTPMWQQPFAP